MRATLRKNEADWQGSLALSTGFRGHDTDLHVDAGLLTPYVSSRFALYEGALDVGVEGILSPHFSLSGHYLSGPSERVGLVGPVLRVSPTLRVAALAGAANGLALGGYVEHDGRGEGALLPGWTLSWEPSCRKTLLANSAGSMSWAACTTASVAKIMRCARVLPTAGWVTPVRSICAWTGSERGSRWTIVSGVLRVGFVNDLDGGSGRTIPEGEVTITFVSDLFVTAELVGGLPRFSGLGSFTEATR